MPDTPTARLAALLDEWDEQDACADYHLNEGATARLADWLLAHGVALPEAGGEAAIREAVHRTALAAARVLPRQVTRRYLTQDEKDAITASIVADFGGAPRAAVGERTHG